MKTELNPKPTERDALLHAAVALAEYAKVHHVSGRNLARDWIKQYGHLIDTGTRDSGVIIAGEVRSNS